MPAISVVPVATPRGRLVRLELDDDQVIELRPESALALARRLLAISRREVAMRKQADVLAEQRRRLWRARPKVGDSLLVAR